MRHWFVYIFLLQFITVSCSQKSEKNQELYRGCLNLNEANKISHVSPYKISNPAEQRLITAIHAGMFRRYTASVDVEPYAVRHSQTDTLNKLFIFVLRTNVFFHPDSCFGEKMTRRMLASDLKYSLELWIKQKFSEKTCPEAILAIEGCNDYLQKLTPEIAGLAVVNDSVFKIRCSKPNPLLMDYLADISAVIVAPEAMAKYGELNTVGIGPFMTDAVLNENTYFVLKRNPLFFMTDLQGNQLPYLDSVKIYFVGQARQELEMFKNNQLHFVAGLSTSYINEFLDDNIEFFQSNPPKYVLMQENPSGKNPVYILLQSSVKGLELDVYSNPDLSKIYLIEELIPEYKADTLL